MALGRDAFLKESFRFLTRGTQAVLLFAVKEPQTVIMQGSGLTSTPIHTPTYDHKDSIVPGLLRSPADVD